MQLPADLLTENHNGVAFGGILATLTGRLPLFSLDILSKC